MNEQAPDPNQADEDILTNEVSDEALEAAAGGMHTSYYDPYSLLPPCCAKTPKSYCVGAKR
jgi:hypothetical protein